MYTGHFGNSELSISVTADKKKSIASIYFEEALAWIFPERRELTEIWRLNKNWIVIIAWILK